MTEYTPDKVVEQMEDGDRYLVELGPHLDGKGESKQLVWIEVLQRERYRDGFGRQEARLKRTSAMYNDVEELDNSTNTISSQWFNDGDRHRISCMVNDKGREVLSIHPVPVDGDTNTVLAMFPEYSERVSQVEKRVQKELRELGYDNVSDMEEDDVIELINNIDD